MDATDSTKVKWKSEQLRDASLRGFVLGGFYRHDHDRDAFNFNEASVAFVFHLIPFESDASTP